MAPISEDIIESLDTVMALLDETQYAYKCYLDQGNRYEDAVRLKHLNESIRILLRKDYDKLPQSQHAHIDALLHHLDTWCELWNIHEKTAPFSDHDVFIFQNTATFPREDVEKIMTYHTSLKTQ